MKELMDLYQSITFYTGIMSFQPQTAKNIISFGFNLVLVNITQVDEDPICFC